MGVEVASGCLEAKRYGVRVGEQVTCRESRERPGNGINGWGNVWRENTMEQSGIVLKTCVLS